MCIFLKILIILNTNNQNFFIIIDYQGFPFFFQNALNAQRVAGLIKTAETMGILDTSSESSKQSDIDEILGFLAALEKVSILSD